MTVYSLTTGAIFPATTPANPFSTGTLNFSYQAADNPLVIGNTLYTGLQNLFFFTADNNIFHTQGDVLSFDITNPQAPTFLDALDNTFGTSGDAEGVRSGGPNPVFDLTQADATTLYAASTTYTIQNDTTQPGGGVLRIVDISTPGSLQLVTTVPVPNTTFATAVTVVGDRAYVVGSEGAGSTRSRRTNKRGRTAASSSRRSM